MRDDLARLLCERRGHFELESGHHGDLWLDLESLCARPSEVRLLATELAERLRPHKPDVICGPLVEGAFVSLFVADALQIEFVYAERQIKRDSSSLYPAKYRIPESLRNLKDRRVAIANDVINAGSAVLGALFDLEASRATLVALGSLLVLGSHAGELAESAAIPLETLETLPNSVWAPNECPLCAAGIALTNFC